MTYHDPLTRRTIRTYVAMDMGLLIASVWSLCILIGLVCGAIWILSLICG